MTNPQTATFDKLHDILSKYKQEHVLHFWNDLTDQEREQLAADISSTNVEKCMQYFNSVSNDATSDAASKLDESKLKPPKDDDFISVSEFHQSQKMDDAGIDPLGPYAAVGLAAINKGAVGVLLMAGGQGTRLGVDYPKGMYDVGLPSKKTLYQLQAERIIRLQNLAKTRVLLPKDSCIPWYVMCSEATSGRTIEFFKAHKYFGLDPENVIFFEQQMLPTFTLDGKFMLETKSRISRAPDGNGGLYHALIENGILDDMKRREVQYIHVYGVDNVLVKVADPSFIGACIKKEVECAAKVVEKVEPDEAIGVVCNVNGTYRVVEYSEISKEMAAARAADGKLVFRAGSIANHFFTVDFLQRVCSQYETLPFHVAKKKIPCIDGESGKLCTPSTPNGIKLEKFVFDSFPLARSFLAYEVSRSEEFSPLKNDLSKPADNAKTCRHDLYRCHRNYLLRAGFNLINSADETAVVEMPGAIVDKALINHNPGEQAVEISPLLSYAGEDLTQLPNLRKAHLYPIDLRHPAESKH